MDLDSSVSVSTTFISALMIIIYGPKPIPVDVKPIEKELPKGFTLAQNYPNPFNPTTRIQFSTDRAAQIQITVYDILGREIARLVNAEFFPGFYSVDWNGRNEQNSPMPSGIYYVRMAAHNLSAESESKDAPYTSMRKMVLLK